MPKESLVYDASFGNAANPPFWISNIDLHMQYICSTLSVMQFGQEALDRVHVMIIIVALSEIYNFAQSITSSKGCVLSRTKKPPQ